jgi:hypothetical protein
MDHLRIERGLFASGPRFAVLVALLAAAATGPSVAVAAVGLAAIGNSSGPASTPVVASAPAGDTVVAGDPSRSREPSLDLRPGELAFAGAQPDPLPEPTPAPTCQSLPRAS